MKVALSINPYDARGGGSLSFARVLAEWLPRYGVEPTFDLAGPCDGILVFAQHANPRLLARQKRRGVKVLHRIDERRDPGETGFRSEKHASIARLNRLADVTIFQSRFVQENMGPLCSAPRGVVIHNGVDRRVFSPVGPATSREGRPGVLHVSWSVGASKRLDRIGDLLGVLGPGARLHLVGQHAQAGLPFLGDPRVQLLGTKSRAEVAALMRGCDFLFFPSELEPCPNTVIEAMACGLPALYHPSGGTPELMGEAGVPMSGSLAGDVAVIVEAREGWRARALARAEEFSADKVVGQYAVVIRDLLEKGA
jgi:glycosyltransferase involved in cell wall biosynthesis